MNSFKNWQNDIQARGYQSFHERQNQFVIAIASGELDFESILDWIKDRIIEK